MLYEKYVFSAGKQAAAVKKWILFPEKKGLIVCGPVGTGKTSIVKTVVSEMGYELLYAGADEFRGTDYIKNLISSSGQSSLFFKKKVILVDDIESIESIKMLNELINSASCPVIMTAEDPYEKRFITIRKNSEIIKLNRPRYDSIEKFLADVCDKEGFSYDKRAISHIAKVCNGDVRSALLDLEIISPEVTYEKVSILGGRGTKFDIFNALNIIFKSTSMENALIAMRNSDNTPDEIFMWIANNVAEQYSPKDAAAAYDMLSKADIFRSRVMKRQAWSLQKYFIELAVLGTSTAKSRTSIKFIRYTPPPFFRRKEGYEELARALHVSKRRLGQYAGLIG